MWYKEGGRKEKERKIKKKLKRVKVSKRMSQLER